MTTQISNLLNEALKLSNKERADLAARLLATLEPEMEASIREEWEAEIDRRLKDLKTGKTRTIPWSEARRRITGEADE
jgi:putative addiction module component (TIGR02574 family)